MKRILCFGDSLTYGTVPTSDGIPQDRYDQTIRWTGILQARLADRATIIEEGLPSRTIDLDDPRPGKVGRNGSTYLWPCVETHAPLDVVIIWLGTNDTKDLFNRTSEQITESLKRMLIVLQEKLTQSKPDSKIIIMSPPQLDVENENAKKWYSTAAPKLAAFPELYIRLAKGLKIDFIDTYKLLGSPSTADGIHLSPEQNQLVAQEVYKKLEEINTI